MSSEIFEDVNKLLQENDSLKVIANLRHEIVNQEMLKNKKLFDEIINLEATRNKNFLDAIANQQAETKAFIQGKAMSNDKEKSLLNIGPLLPIPRLDSPIASNLKDNLANEFHRRLVHWIQNFDASLDTEHEVGVQLVNFGQAITFHLQSMRYWNPSLISFIGVTDQGEPVELIQHVSQISILLLKVARQDTSQPKRPIGFVWNENDDKKSYPPVATSDD